MVTVTLGRLPWPKASTINGDGVGIAELAVDGDSDLGTLALAKSIDDLVGDDEASGVAVALDEIDLEGLLRRAHARNSLIIGAMAVGATIWFCPARVLCCALGRFAAIAFCAFCIQASDLPPPMVRMGIVA